MVFTFDLPEMQGNQRAPVKPPPMAVYDLRQNGLDTHDLNGLRFTPSGCIPFDFDRQHVIYMQSHNRGTNREQHELYLYKIESKET